MIGLKKLNFQNKVLVSVALSFFSLIIGIAIILFFTLRDDLYENRLRETRFENLAYAAQISQTFAQNHEIASTIASREVVVQYTKTPDYDSLEKVNSVLESYNIGNKYSAIYILDQQGDTIASIDEKLLNQNYNSKDYFQTSINGTPHLDVSLKTDTNKIHYYISHPIEESDGVFGVIVLELNPVFIEKIFSDNLTKTISSVEQQHFIVNKNSIILYDSANKVELKSLSPVDYQLKTKILREKKYPGIKFENLGYEDFSGILDSTINENSVLVKDRNDQGTRFVIRRIEDTDFFVVTIPNSTDIHISIFKTVLEALVLVASIMMLTVVILSYFVSRLLLNIEKIIKNIKLFRENDTVRKNTIKTGDELEILAESFYQLSKELVKEKADIESKVEERTKQLQSVNEALIGREMKMIDLKQKIKRLENERQKEKK
ncbi:hypothetical protein GF389_04910 [Candidatus Dojkabacteria bacterium]|nr:hypothetical protein [Candidatus Dojkabacteria bacterium]